MTHDPSTPPIALPEPVASFRLRIPPTPKLSPPWLSGVEQGSFVSVRPASEERTYLGIYLGDVPIRARWSVADGVLELTQDDGPFFPNPCLWVPDLNQLIYGYESWWSPIASEADLRQITDADIESVWYVRALRALSEKKDEET